jgi:hypothetical protein
MPMRVLDRSSGQWVMVDDADAQAGLLEGRYGVSSRQAPIGLIGSDGQEYEADAAHLGRALQGGQFRLESAGETEANAIRREFGDSEGTTFGEGVARELTFGVSDYAAPALAAAAESFSTGEFGVRGEAGQRRASALAQRAIRGRREVNPNAAVAGEITGAVLPMLLPGAGQAAAATRAARAAGTARSVLGGLGTVGRATGFVGEAIGGRVARAVAGEAPGLGRRILSRAAGTAAEGVVEGGLGGIRQVLTEDALGEHSLTAERVIAGAGLGALFGGATGFGLGGAGSALGEGFGAGLRGGRQLLSSGSETLSRAWQQRTGRELAPGVGELLTDTYARASSLASGADQNTIRRFVDLGADGQRARAIVARGDDVLEDGTRRIREDLTALEGVSAHVQDFARGSLKRQPIARTIRTDTIGDQLAAAQSAVGRANALSDDILANPHIYAGGGGVAQGRHLATAVRGFGEDLARAMERAGSEPAEAAADIYITLDRMKRRIGQMQNQTRDPEAQRVLRDLYDSEFRPLLEQEALWGAPVAQLQRETNAAWTNYLTRRRDFEGMFLAEGERDAVDAFRRLSEGDPAKIRGFLGRVGSAANDRAEETFREVLTSQAALSDAITRNFDVPTELAASAQGARAGLDRIRRTLDEVTESASTLNQFRQLSGAGSVERAIIGGDIGSSIAGAPGAIIAGALFNPGQAVRVLGVLDRLQSQTNTQISDSVRRFLGRAAKGGASAARGVGRAASRGARAAARPLPKVSVIAYREKIAELNALMTDPERQTRELAEGTSAIGADAPQVQQHIQTSAVRALNYLHQQIPAQNRNTAAELIPGRERPPARADMERFMRAARVVEDPLSILEDLENRRLRRASVDTLRAVYPQLHSQIVQEVASAFAEPNATPPSYSDRIALGTLLGVPTDPSLRPEFLASIQASHAANSGPQQQPPSAAPRRDAPDVAGQLESQMQRIESRSM